MQFKIEKINKGKKNWKREKNKSKNLSKGLIIYNQRDSILYKVKKRTFFS